MNEIRTPLETNGVQVEITDVATYQLIHCGPTVLVRFPWVVRLSFRTQAGCVTCNNIEGFPRGVQAVDHRTDNLYPCGRASTVLKLKDKRDTKFVFSVTAAGSTDSMKFLQLQCDNTEEARRVFDALDADLTAAFKAVNRRAS